MQRQRREVSPLAADGSTERSAKSVLQRWAKQRCSCDMQQQKTDSTQDNDTGQEDKLPDAHTRWLQHEKMREAAALQSCRGASSTRTTTDQRLVGKPTVEEITQ
jgi:hypothetical protein